MRLEDIYINGTGNISIQEPLSKNGIFFPIAYSQPHIRCIEPNYKEYFDPIVSRRMSKIIKRAIVSAKQAIAESGIEKPDAIITGTGLGCVEDTEKFLDALIRNEEKFLQPTYFIQSTHNTISSQIAINLSCNGYNNTYIHRGVSFENALMDALLLFKKKEIHSALVTGNDEMTPNYFIILGRIDYWKEEVKNTLEILKQNNSTGSFAGEGSVSLLFSDKKSEKSYAKLVGFDLFYKPTISVEEKIKNFLNECQLQLSDIDVCLTGMNGDKENDTIYSQVLGSLFSADSIGYYKQLCGQYYTASSYGLLSAACCIQKGEMPAHMILSGKTKKEIKHILLYNHFQNKDHSLVLLSAC